MENLNAVLKSLRPAIKEACLPPSLLSLEKLSNRMEIDSSGFLARKFVPYDISNNHQFIINAFKGVKKIEELSVQPMNGRII